ncbi:MAG: alcohol dehydrogenase catalytic domain-containing protein [Candidatus Atribacteria bacterium]|nr:alcohol dehydrogenase catalytic domain-containing protein [Candidatus Atribacteria bacterium]
MELYKGLLLEKAKKIKIIENKLVEPGQGEVLIRINNVGLCGSDLHLYEGTYSAPSNYPIFFGHEWAGTVEKIGRDVKALTTGDKVTGDCSIYCNNCEYCNKDKNLCKNIQKYGITIDGASRQYIIRSEQYLYKLPETISLKIASLLEPLAVACHAASRLEKVIGNYSKQRILVYGGGTIGLSVVAVLKKVFNYNDIYLYDLIPTRMKLAQKIGAKILENISLVKSGEQEQIIYSDFYHPDNFDVIFETTGVDEVFNNALNIVNPLGSIVVIGFIPEVKIKLKLITLKALNIIGSIGGTGEFEKLIPVVNKNQEYFSNLISHRFFFTDWLSAFKVASQREKAIKVQLEFEKERKR